MADNQNVETETVQHENRLTFEPKVLEKIANYSVSNIDGILELRGDWTNSVRDFFSANDNRQDTKGVNAEVGEKEVALDLEVVGEYGKDLRAAFDKVIDIVVDNVQQMTGLKVVEVNMNVTDVMTANEYKRRQNEEQRQEEERRRERERDIRNQNRHGEYSDGSRVQ